MAYDAATGTIVLFSGDGTLGVLGDTWTWDGSTWTKQAPAASPPARSGASMAYDAATGTVVLFGGARQARLPRLTPGPGMARPGPSRRPRPTRPPGRTRRWPTTRPPAASSCSAASASGRLGDTWTWDG